MRKIILLIVTLPIYIFSKNPDFAIDKLAIKVQNQSREYFFTNKISAFYYGESNSKNKNSFQGLTINEQKIFTDYKLKVNNILIDRKKSWTHFYPYKLVRNYPKKIKETFALADSLNIILIEFTNLHNKEIELNFDLSVDSIIHRSLNLTTLISKNHTIKIESNILQTDISFSSTELTIKFKGKKLNRILLSVDENGSYIKSFEKLIVQKKKRIQNLINQIGFKTNLDELNKAFYWNVIALDALVTHQGMKGIWAGLPWFNNYWGRDTFISLPAATFLIGNFKDAKEILLSFAAKQDTNPESHYFGRIPNRITLSETIYNTADGTPWFVIQSYNYFKQSNDTDFARKIFPHIKLATDAFLKNSVDSNYFLIHQDSETWMDAVGPDGPWSPRGNRSNDIQYLWFKHLKITSYFSYFFGDSINGKKYFDIANQLKIKILREFIDTSKLLIYDHLKPDGTKDSSYRPNMFFFFLDDFLNVPATDFSKNLNHSTMINIEKSILFKILKNVVSNLVYPYGVLSLSYKDENFHPFHHYQPFYPPDAAYHNGVIWLWNLGPVISALTNNYRVDLSYILLKELIHQTLDEGAIGTLSELMDPFPKPNKTKRELSGTFTQAWSNAEFIRVLIENFGGINIDDPYQKIILSPAWPEDIKEFKTNTFISDRIVHVKYKSKTQFFTITIDSRNLIQPYNLEIIYTNSHAIKHFIKTRLQPLSVIDVHIPKFQGNPIVKINSHEVSDYSVFVQDIRNIFELAKDIKFAVPVFNPDWKSIQKSEYILLSLDDIKSQNEKARLIYSGQLENKINFNYTLPLNKNFKDGMTELKYLELSEDTSNYYFTLQFEDLVNPNWHPEYGFQLTFLAICLQTNSDSNYGRFIGKNSNLILEDSLLFNRIIYIGGGIEICDGNLKILAKYIPASEDLRNPLGDAHNNLITFSMPKKLIGKLKENSTLTIAIGLQDDHGGSGIGQFRTVEKVASEWKGGEKINKNEPNVYEFIYINIY